MNQIRKSNEYKEAEQSAAEFQSPKSGKFESNPVKDYNILRIGGRFNPLNRGNLNQISETDTLLTEEERSFNPLNRGNLNQIGNVDRQLSTIRYNVSIP